MPQFDKLSFFTQLFWLLVLFNSFYFIVIHRYFSNFAVISKVRKKFSIKVNFFENKISQKEKILFAPFFANLVNTLLKKISWVENIISNVVTVNNLTYIYIKTQQIFLLKNNNKTKNKKIFKKIGYNLNLEKGESLVKQINYFVKTKKGLHSNFIKLK